MQSIREFQRGKHPHPHARLKEILGLILQQNSFDSTGHTEQLRANKDSSRFREYLQLSSVETEILLLVEKTLNDNFPL